MKQFHTKIHLKYNAKQTLPVQFGLFFTVSFTFRRLDDEFMYLVWRDRKEVVVVILQLILHTSSSLSKMVKQNLFEW